MGRKEIAGHKRRHHDSNRRLAEVYHYAGEARLDTTLRLTSYTANHVRSEALQPEKLSAKRLYAEPETHWIEVNGLSDASVITQIVNEFGFHRLDAKDILTPQHVAKVEISNERTLIVLNVCYYNEQTELQKEHICLLMSHNVIISFTERNDYPLFDGVRQAIADNLLDIRNHNIKQLLIHLLNAVTSCLADSVAMTEELLEDIEDSLLDISQVSENTGISIQQRRRDAIAIRRSTLPLKEEFAKMVHTVGYFSPEQLPFFNDTNDQVLFVLQTADMCREIIDSLMDLYFSNNDLRLNSIIKRLTIVSTIFIPLTFLAGIWGMNFRFMPELDWRYGYAVAWLVMLVAAFVSWLYLRKKGWN